eukprot:scaffold6942_cov72-Phaeocystis_antarctica.AAC.6
MRGSYYCGPESPEALITVLRPKACTVPSKHPLACRKLPPAPAPCHTSLYVRVIVSQHCLSTHVNKRWSGVHSTCFWTTSSIVHKPWFCGNTFDRFSDSPRSWLYLGRSFILLQCVIMGSCCVFCDREPLPRRRRRRRLLLEINSCWRILHDCRRRIPDRPLQGGPPRFSLALTRVDGLE